MIRSSLARHTPRRETTAEELDGLRRLAWDRQGVIAIRLDDDRLTWPERETLKGIAVRLYGERGP